MRRTSRFIVSAAALLGVVATSCSSDADDTTSGSSVSQPVTEVPGNAAASTTQPPATPPPTAEAPTTLLDITGDLTVFAAASLTTAFTEIGDAFMIEHPDTTVTFNFAASSELATQIGEGAAADVFASADLNNMTKLTDAGGTASDPVVFAKNIAAIIVAPGNPKRITAVADLARDDVIFVQCAPEVPCGKYATKIFENASVTVTPKSLEENVKAVVTKVTLGEADAGIVYATDVIAAGAAAEGVEIPSDINVVAEYPIAATAAAPNPGAATAFVDFVLSDQGRKILASYGFIEP